MTDERISKDRMWLAVAFTVAQRSTCARRAVGCVLVDRRGHVVATGYNGVASGETHCTEHPCAGAQAEPGEMLDRCEAVHAEQNALLQCPDEQAIEACYVTVSPCVHCVKMLMNTSCRRVVFATEYVHDAVAKELWTRGIVNGRTWERHKE